MTRSTTGPSEISAPHEPRPARSLSLHSDVAQAADQPVSEIQTLLDHNALSADVRAMLQATIPMDSTAAHGDALENLQSVIETSVQLVTDDLQVPLGAGANQEPINRMGCGTGDEESVAVIKERLIDMELRHARQQEENQQLRELLQATEQSRLQMEQDLGNELRGAERDLEELRAAHGNTNINVACMLRLLDEKQMEAEAKKRYQQRVVDLEGQCSVLERQVERARALLVQRELPESHT